MGESMTLQDAEQDAGVRLEKTDEYTRHRDAMKAHGFAVVHGLKADAMRDELRAEVVRLAEELEHANKLCIRDLEHTEQRAEDAEQALAAAREEIERMKVCCLCSRLTGNWVFMCCAEMMEENSAENPDEWPHSSTVVKLDDHCHFIPSRWTPTTEAPE